MVRDARGLDVAALTWVLWTRRNRLQNLEATSRKISGSTSFQIFGKHLEERLRKGSKYLELWNFLEKFGSFKTGLSRFGIKFPFSISLLSCVRLGNMEKMKNLNRGLLVGRFKQNAGAGHPFFYDVDIMVSTVLSNKTKIKK